MSEIPIIWIIVALIALFGLVYFVFRRDKKHEMKPETLLPLGVMFFVLGIANGNNVFTILGSTFMASAGWAMIKKK